MEYRNFDKLFSFHKVKFAYLLKLWTIKTGLHFIITTLITPYKITYFILSLQGQ